MPVEDKIQKSGEPIKGYVSESARELPVVEDVDVVVVGGGCTGVFAAVRAARLGARVAIIEKQNCFGGMATAGAVDVWHSLYDTTKTRQIIRGLTHEVIERLARRGAALRQKGLTEACWLNTEDLKIELDELITQHGIRPFLNTFYVAPWFKDNRLAAVVIENKNGRQAVRTRQFIDATGDGDLARDLKLSQNRPAHLQPPTTCAKIYGLATLGDFDWERAAREHGAEFGLEEDLGWGGPIPGLPDIQLRCDHHVFGVDTTDADELTRAEIEGRRRVRALMDLIRKYGPPGTTIALVDLAATLGVRETRRFVARYRLTGDDVLSGKRFDDAIANGTYPVDIHHAHGPGITFRFLDGTELVIPGRGMPGRKGRWRPPSAENPTFYQIPFRCLVQDRVPNLVFAGRMLDVDDVAFGAVRVMVNLNQTGEAAGVACALAVEEGVAVCDVDAQRLRRTLAAGGSIIL